MKRNLSKRPVKGYKFKGLPILSLLSDSKSRIFRKTKASSSTEVRKKRSQGISTSIAEQSKSFTLGSKSENIVSTVILPETKENYSVEVWICAHASDFYFEIYTFYLFCKEHYTETYKELGEGFPDGRSYVWEGSHYSGGDYVSLVFGWFQDLINDPAVFVDDDKTDFPLDFKTIISKMFTRMLRIIGILVLVEGPFFKSHIEQNLSLQAFLKRFTYFTTYWKLVDLNGPDAILMSKSLASIHAEYKFDVNRLNSTGAMDFSETHKHNFLAKYRDSNNHKTEAKQVNIEWDSLLEEDMNL